MITESLDNRGKPRCLKPALAVWCVVVLNLCATDLLCAPSRGASSAINRPFIDSEFAQWVARFERPGREVYDQRHRIVAATGVGPGMTVADIGAGTGLFTRLFARQVGEAGTVYAVDISRSFIANILRISRANGQFNVRGVVNSADELPLPPASIDIAFVCDTYHHFEKPAAMLASIQRALKPTGSLTVVDFRKRPGISTPWVMDHVRAGRTQVIGEIESAGFRRVDSDDFLEINFLQRFVPVDSQD
jgi:predicted methyltransferase